MRRLAALALVVLLLAAVVATGAGVCVGRGGARERGTLGESRCLTTAPTPAPPHTHTDAPPAADVSLLKFTPRADTHIDVFEGELSFYAVCGGSAAVDLPGEEVLGQKERYPPGRVIVARLAPTECATCRFKVRRRIPFVDDDTIGPPFDVCASDFAAAEGGELTRDERGAFDAVFWCGECWKKEVKVEAAAAAAPPPPAPSRRALSGGAIAAIVLSCLAAGGGLGAAGVVVARRAAAAAARARAAEFAAVFASEGDVELDAVTTTAASDGAPLLARLARPLARLYDTSVV